MSNDEYDYDNDEVGAVSSAATSRFVQVRVPQATQAPQQPAPSSWFGATMPPWHLWGNRQLIPMQPTGTFGLPAGVGESLPQTQMLRVAYNRPETFHWLFQSTLVLPLPTPGVGETVRVDVFWDVTAGIGRNAIVMPAFETHSWIWQNPQPPPAEPANTLRTTTAVGNRLFSVIGGVFTNAPTVISELVAQDIQVQVRTRLLTNMAAAIAVTVEAQAQMSPINHIRPDWFRDGPQTLQFAGGEVEGR